VERDASSVRPGARGSGRNALKLRGAPEGAG
jgi:hypothetical protein